MIVGKLLNDYILDLQTYISYNELKGSIFWNEKTERHYIQLLLKSRSAYIQAYKNKTGRSPNLESFDVLPSKRITIYSQLV